MFWSLNKPFLFLAMPKLIDSLLWWFVVDFVSIMSVCWLVYWLFFRTEVPQLKRASTPISLFAFYRESAKRDSTVGLVFGFLLCLVFIWAGFWIIRTEFYFWIGWMIIIFSGLCALPWGYTLFLKLTMPKDREVGDRESEA
jgi:hypothetical protein